MADKRIDVQGVLYTEEELQTLSEWMQAPGRKLFDRYIAAQRDECHDRAKTVSRPMYDAGLGQKRIVPWDHHNENRVVSLAMETAYDNVLALPDIVKQELPKTTIPKSDKRA